MDINICQGSFISSMLHFLKGEGGLDKEFDMKRETARVLLSNELFSQNASIW